MLQRTHPKLVVATDNLLIATDIGLHTVVATTRVWTATVRYTRRALIGLGAARGSSDVQRVLYRGSFCDWARHTAGQQSRKDEENRVKVHLG
jgi:hypothetical protein